MIRFHEGENYDHDIMGYDNMYLLEMNVLEEPAASIFTHETTCCHNFNHNLNSSQPDGPITILETGGVHNSLQFW